MVAYRALITINRPSVQWEACLVQVLIPSEACPASAEIQAVANIHGRRVVHSAEFPKMAAYLAQEAYSAFAAVLAASTKIVAAEKLAVRVVLAERNSAHFVEERRINDPSTAAVAFDQTSEDHRTIAAVADAEKSAAH